MKDEKLLEIYMQGFKDELNNNFDKTKTNPNLDGVAYNLGSLHALVGEDCRRVDNLSDEEIIKIIRGDKKI